DVREDPEYLSQDWASALGIRSILSVPMLREGNPIGVITVSRVEAGPFSDSQIALLRTFANQAVIAIENVRLFNETEETLEQQTATVEILRVIASSPTDIQPVLDAVAERATRLCEAYDAVIFRSDGDVLRRVAHQGEIPALSTLALARGTVGGRAAIERRTIAVDDILTEVAEYPEGSAAARPLGFRSLLAVPLLREGEAIGIIIVRRREVQPFTPKQIALLETFAAQAVIAIENVRLFTEIQVRNRELTSALERETAPKEVLETISRTTFDLPLVLATLIERAARLCRAPHGVIFRVEGDFLHLEADNGASPEFREFRRAHPIRIGPGTASGRAAPQGRTGHTPDVLADPDYQESKSQRLTGYRTILAVPMLREGRVMGVIGVFRTNVEPFDDREIALVATFANQAVIAIENVRLFQEIQARNR